MPGCGSTEPGEGQLPGRGNASPEWLYSFPPVGGNEVSFFHERKRILTVIQKAVADRQLHGRKRGNKETSWLRRKREYTGKVNERYAQREVSGRSNHPSPLCEQHTLSPCARALKKQVCTPDGSGII